MRAFASIRLLSAVLLLSAIAPPAAPAAGGVSMFHGDPSGSGRVSSASADALAGVRFSVQTGGPIRATPVVRDGTLYLAGGDGTLYALDGHSGAERWRRHVGGALTASPASDGRSVWLATAEGELLALAARDGRVRWRRPLGADRGDERYWDYFRSSPVIEDGVVYVGSGAGAVLAFDAESGRPRWRHEAGARVRGSVAVGGGLVVFGTSAGHVRAVDARTGALRWDFATEGAGHAFADAGNDTTSVVTAPTIAGDLVVAGGRDGFVYGLDLARGAQRWRTTHDGSSWILGFAWDGTHVFVGSGSAALVQAAEPATGAEAWRVRTRGAVFSGLALAGDTLLFGDFSGTVRAVDRRSGVPRWQFPLGARVFATPVVAGDTVYCASDRGVLVALAIAPAGEARPPGRRVVAWEGPRGDQAFGWFQDGVDAQLRAQLLAAGYEALDEAALATLMREQRPDGPRSVVVFADDRIPPALAEPVDGTPLVRGYLDRGGKIVLPGPNPLAFVTDPATGALTDIDFDRPARVFGLDYPPPEALGGYYAAWPTAAGRAAGLRRFGVGNGAVRPGPRVTPLALDETGHAQAWRRDYGGGRGTGLVQLALPRAEPADAAELEAVSEEGVSW